MEAGTPAKDHMAGDGEAGLLRIRRPSEDAIKHEYPNTVRSSIIRGSLVDLPPVMSKTVRIFISSTFSDMVTERNALMETVYPRLKDFCRQFGLEFQVVDMRWGIREEVQDDHMTTSLCMQEIKECQRVSMGPTFVVLFGQKYGFRPFPVTIDAEEFQNMRKVLVDDQQDVALLDQWFQRDDNQQPPVYSLLKISTFLPNYVNTHDAKLQEADRQKWGEIFEELQVLLRHGSTLLFDAGTFTAADKEKYFMSVTEDEIRHGIQYDQQRDRQICLFRIIEDLLQHRYDKNGSKFIDMMGDEIDGEAQRLLKNLRDKNIPEHLSKENMANFIIKWCRPSGINETKHKDYIRNLCDMFYKMFRTQLLIALEKQQDFKQDALLAEILQHAKLCELRCKAFQGRRDIMHRIENYVRHPQTQPMVMYGESGSGKTSIMAMVAKFAATWTTSEPVIVTRLLGTTPKSSSIFPALQTMCEQICHNYDQTYEEIQDDFTKLFSYFHELLKVATSEKPLVIILDALDQLSTSNFPYRLTWLPFKLPPHVYFILSTLPDEHKMLHRLGAVIYEPLNFVQIQPLGGQLSVEIIKTWLSSDRQTLTIEQLALVKIACNYCSLPLYAKLVYEEVKRWKSFYSLDRTSLKHTVKGLINVLFDRIELHHGKCLVAKSLSYLTASRSGLTEAELEDILSLDDEVLDEIFVFWVPPVRRIPPLLWTRIRNDLSCYLVERAADGVTVLAWYHRQFKEVVKDRYLSDRHYRVGVHSNLADFFLGKWGGGKKKPYHYSEHLQKKLKTTSKEGEADRKLPTQPLKWKTKSKLGLHVHYNLRKLNELPYHLQRSDRYAELWKEVFYNYRWLHAKLKATSITEVMSDAMLVHRHKKGHRVELIMAALRVAGYSLKVIPNTLASEILGRLKPSSDQFDLVTSLVKQCKKEGLKHCALLPSFVCFDAPIESLIFNLEGYRKHVTDIVFSSDSHCLYSVSLDGCMIAWDVKTGDLFYNTNISYTLPGHHSRIFLAKPNFLVLENYTDRSPLCIFNANTGDLTYKLSERRDGFIHNTVVAGHNVIREGELFDVRTGAKLKSLACLKDFTGFVTLAGSPNCELIFVGTMSQTMIIDLESEVVHKVMRHENIPSEIVFTKDGQRALIGYAVSCLVEVYNINLDSAGFGTRMMKFEYIKDFPNFCFSPGDTYRQEVFEIKLSEEEDSFLVNVKKLYLFVVSMASGKSVMLNQEIFKGHELPVHTADFAYKGKSVIGIVGNYMCIWNSENGDLHAHMRLIGSEEDKFLLKVAPVGNIAATASKQEMSIKVWDLDKMQEAVVPSIHVYANPVDVVHIVPDVKLAYIKIHRPMTSRRGYQFIDFFGIDVWNLATNHRRTFLPFDKHGQLKQMTTSQDGQLLIFLCETKTAAKTSTRILITDVHQNKLMAHINQPGCYKVHLSYDNRFLLAEASESRLYDLKHTTLVKIFPNAEHATFTTDSKYVLLVQEKKKIVAFCLKTSEMTEILLSNMVAMRLYAVPRHYDQVLVFTSSPQGAHRRQTRLELWNFMNAQRLRKFDNVGGKAAIDISKDGCIVVDSYQQVFDIQIGKTLVHQCWSTNTHREHVKITDDGLYVIWADTKPMDCIKAMRVKDGRIVAEVSTHAKVTSLNLTNHGYMVLIGCQDGHFLSFTLHNMKEDEDENDSNNEDTIVVDLEDNRASFTMDVIEEKPTSTFPDDDLESPPVMFRHRSLSNSAEKPRRNANSGSNLLAQRLSQEDESGGHPSFERQNSSSSTENMRVRSVMKLSTDELLTLGKVNNNGLVSTHYPHLTEKNRSTSDSNLVGNFSHRSNSQCHISKTELIKLDPLYQRTIINVTDAQLPKASMDLRHALETAGNVMYSISCECDPPEGRKVRKSSCIVQ